MRSNYQKTDLVPYSLLAEAPAPYTNAYFNGATPLFKINSDLYLGLLYFNKGDSRKMTETRSRPEKSTEYVSSETGQGMTFSLPLLNKQIYWGIEILEQGLTYSEFRRSGGTASQRLLIAHPYNTYTLGLIWPFSRDWVLGLTHTMPQERLVYLEEKLYSFSLVNNAQYTGITPAIAGCALSWQANKVFALGLGLEFTDISQQFNNNSSAEGYFLTKPFTKYSMALEARPCKKFMYRLFGSYTKNKDVRADNY